ncbi:MAG: zinc metalloprotease HtpX [Candidatus Omnitrophota bacterium]|nr:M48 family metalloprotease [Candidatus Omnitrophota bacterium]MBU1929299.1 M48 family metalloprotease [Candidatus Omnitrophota bacterium]MBU2035591.1 M48 family metalloprotease [Candidatus Omnitrophota bacterium]MBU2222370.1 M48 family metalloprotease [Candidatus Omnitrophota bacterium]
MWLLHLKMWLLLTALFAIIYAVIVMIGSYLGIGGFGFYLSISLAMMFIQYLIGPKIVEWTMRIKYVKRQDQPKLFQMVESLAVRAGIPMPKIGIAQISLPNAFAFGRGIRDGRVCVTQGILNLLSDDELKAVLGHELSHLKNRDVLTITLLSVIPMIMYRIAWQFLFFGRRRDERGGNTALLGMAAFIFYFITNLLVLYASRIREYFADQGSVLLGNQPKFLASSLYKLAYSSARTDKESLKEVEGLKAFFINDPSQGLKEIRELKQLDLDNSGTIDASELSVLRNKQVRLRFADRLLESFSTHPNMLKRIKALSRIRA